MVQLSPTSTSLHPGGEMKLRVTSTGRSRWSLFTFVAVAVAILLVTPGHAPAAISDTSAQYDVVGPRTFADVNAIAQTGASVDAVEDGRVHITATLSEVS